MLFIKEFVSKKGNKVKAIYACINDKEYFICFCK